MPELPEEMYCSQQICIPPAFPYLLRQYAKAAIRTQPTDLLKWSTAYFRCLALNLPPPVKPRLEYPIPLDYHGLTPGWLKALVNQIPNAQTVSFKLLWDRWVGTCLKHNTLIEILLLGRFTDNTAIPWWKFIALCAGHLTENLTHTMVMVCEILTEEPEGGSSMIPVKAFMDIYRFLAEIDASKAQHLPNIHFTDSVLGLYEEEEEEKSMVSEITDELDVTIDEVEEEKEISVTVKEVEESSAVVSCPDIIAEETPYETLDKTAFPPKGTEVLPESIDKTFALGKEVVETSEEGENKDDDGNQNEIQNEILIGSEEGEKKNEIGEMENVDEKIASKDKLKDDEPQDAASGSPEKNTEIKKSVEEEEKSEIGGSAVDIQEDQDQDDEKEESGLSAEEDDDMLNSAQPAEDDIEKRKKKKDKVEAVTKTEVDVDGYQSVDTVEEDTTGRFKPKERQALPGQPARLTDVDLDGTAATEKIDDKQLQETKEISSTTGKQQEEYESTPKDTYELSMNDSGEEYGEEKKADEESTYLPRYEWFDIPPVPGIGPTVPIELVEIVDEYMVKMAKIQHGVVMPRNIRHFACPPLEVFDLQDEY